MRLNDLTLEYTSDDAYNEHIYVTDDERYVVVGYLTNDSDAPSPLDGDAMGTIIHDQTEVHCHLGLDTEGQPNYDPYYQIAIRLCGYDELSNDAKEEVRCGDMARKMWDEAWPDVLGATPYAVGLDAEGEVTSTLGRITEAWIPDKYWAENFSTPSENIAARDSVLKEYLKWREGECYGITTEIFELQDDGGYMQLQNDSMWGLVGSEYAGTELKEQFDREVSTLIRTVVGHYANPNQLELPLDVMFGSVGNNSHETSEITLAI